MMYEVHGKSDRGCLGKSQGQWTVLELSDSGQGGYGQQYSSMHLGQVWECNHLRKGARLTEGQARRDRGEKTS
jgi:hypothetical protein